MRHIIRVIPIIVSARKTLFLIKMVCRNWWGSRKGSRLLLLLC